MKLKRKALKTLKQWKTTPDHKPLLIRGARQTGKTWLVNEFANGQYDNIVSVDFMQRPSLSGIFEQDLDPQRIIRQLELAANQRILPGRTLLFFDEIQESPLALTSLKYFTEQAPDYDIIATGSYMGISKHGKTSFPVGKVTMMNLHPLSFAEYLDSIGQDMIADTIREGRFEDIPQALEPQMNDLLKTYMWVGGMPAALSAHLDNGIPQDVRTVQQDILNAYDLDFSKHAAYTLGERIRLVWNTLPSQLAKENRKFVYGVVRQGARAREYEEALTWLTDYGIITKVPRLDALHIPLPGYESLNTFKIYLEDTGILGALSGLDVNTLVNKSKLFSEFKGAFVEQYVCQQLVAQGIRPRYWANPNPQGNAEIDFVMEQGDEVFPIEVKSSSNIRARSLSYVCNRYGLHGIRIGEIGYRKQSWLTNIPLWCVDGLGEYLKRQIEKSRENPATI